MTEMTTAPVPVPFSHASDAAGSPAHCLVCWAYGSTITRHRPQPRDAAAPRAKTAVLAR